MTPGGEDRIDCRDSARLALNAEPAQVHEKSAVVFQHFIMELLALTVLIVTLVSSLVVLRKRNGMASTDRAK